MTPVKIRLKEDDRAKIKSAAEALGLPLATFIRLAALKAAASENG